MKSLLVFILLLASNVASAQYFPTIPSPARKEVKIFGRNVVDTVPISKGGTGAKTAVAALANLGASPGLIPTAVKTANYTASAGDFVPVDNTAGNDTITLPTAPADGSRVGVKIITQGGTNTTVMKCAGSGVFNKAGGSTTLSLQLLNQAYTLQYKASGAIWYAVSTDAPLSGLDARYVSSSAVLPVANGGTGLSAFSPWKSVSVSGSDVVTTGQSLVDVTGLTFSAAASTTYEIDAWLDVLTDAGSTGIKFGINSTGTSPSVFGNVTGPTTTATNVTSTGLAAANTASGTEYTAGANTEGLTHIYAVVKSGTGSPTISIQFLKVTSGTATIKIGSKLNYRVQ